MSISLRHLMITGLSIVFLLGQVGCATGPYLLPPPPSELVRGRLGTIGVVSAQFTPRAELPPPAKGGGAGAGRGMATGAGKGAALVGKLASGCVGEGCAIVLLMIPAAIIGGVVGGVAGAASAVPAEAVADAETALKSALADLTIQETLRGHILRIAKARTPHAFVLVTEHGPSAPNGNVSYRSLASQGIDTVLETGVLTLDLVGEWDVNPPLALVMAVRTRLIRVTDDAELYAHTLEYLSGFRTFTDWAADNAQPFRNELSLAYQSLSEKIVEELFLLYLLPEASVHRPDAARSAVAQPPAR